MSRRFFNNKVRLIFFLVLFWFFLTIFLFCLFKIFMWNKDNKKTDEQIDNVYDNVSISEVNDDLANIVVQDDDIEKSNPYWDYIKMSLIDVDFSELKLINSAVKGWIQVNGTNINYPFVQYSDNEYYLSHSFDNSYNGAGWVFLDYRNNVIDEKNTIIYAHGRLDKTMFGSLKNILTSGWLNDSNNFVVKLSTESENTLWQVFSVYRIPTTSDYIRTVFYGDEDYADFLNMLLNRSSFNFNTNINYKDRILTLSTCYNDNDKVVLHAKLIKIEKK